MGISKTISAAAALPAKRRRLDDVPSPTRDTPYRMSKRRVRTFKKNGATDTTYEVKFTEGWQGRKLTELISELYNMFDDAIGSAATGLAENDLARVVLHHDNLDSPLVVPLRPINQLDASVVMSHVENALNSHQNLALDSSFRIDIGVIQLPRGGSQGMPIITLSGRNNSVYLKTSLIEIVNKDQLCMSRAIAMCWSKINTVTREDWNRMTMDSRVAVLDDILVHRKVPASFYSNMRIPFCLFFFHSI